MVWTGLSTGAPQRGSVAIADGRILAIGDDSDIARYAGPKTQRIQADGGLVLPGFTDGHTHFIDGGFQLTSVNLRDAATPPEFVRRPQGIREDPQAGRLDHRRRLGPHALGRSGRSHVTSGSIPSPRRIRYS